MSHTVDWGRRVHELTGEARQVYARALRRYHELLTRVARGELAANDVQRQFQEYLQEQAPASTRTMVELSVGLLTGLVYIEAVARDALLDGLLPPEGPPPRPPDPGSVDISSWFQTLSDYASEQAARSLARNQRLVDRLVAGQVSPAEVQEQGRRYLEHAAPQLLNEVMALGLGFVEKLQQSSATMADALYDRLLGPDTRGETERPEPPLCLDLQGPANDVAAATLVFENTRTSPVTATCEASDFAPRDGGARIRAPLQIEPSALSLPPGQRGEVQVRLLLASPPFEAGRDYVATLVIRGISDQPQIVQVLASLRRVAAAPVVAAPSERVAAPASRPRARKTAPPDRPSSRGARPRPSGRRQTGPAGRKRR